MIETITAVNTAVNNFIWGVPAMAVSYTHLTLPTKPIV